MRTYPPVLGVLVVGLLAVGLLAVAPATATAQAAACEDVLVDEANATTGPGGELADAIGDQRSEIGSELNDRWFDARLANATSDEERATIVAAEVDRIATRLEALETCWGAHESAREGGDATDQLDPVEIDVLNRQARSLHSRLNETDVVAANLSAPLRERHGIDEESLTELERRVERMRQVTARASNESVAGDR